MNPKAKRMVADKMRNYPHQKNEYDAIRREYNGSGMNYGVEGRFRDGRRHEYHDRERHEEVGALTEATAKKWTDHMENEDGTKGAHWTMEQTTQLLKQKGLSVDPVEFFAVMNMLYSDFCAVMKKYNANNADIYTDLALAWINDKDAEEHKTSRYFHYIVED